MIKFANTTVRTYGSKQDAKRGIERFVKRTALSGVVFDVAKVDERFQITAEISPIAPSNAEAVCYEAGFVISFAEVSVAETPAEVEAIIEATMNPADAQESPEVEDRAPTGWDVVETSTEAPIEFPAAPEGWGEIEAVVVFAAPTEDAVAPTRQEHESRIIAGAVKFTANLFLGAGSYDRAERETLDEAIALGEQMKAAHPECTRTPMIYAVDSKGASTLVTNAEIAARKSPAPSAGLAQTRGDALAAARLAYGVDAVVGEAFVIKKTVRGEWYWGQPIEATKSNVVPIRAQKAVEPKAPKAAKPAKVAKEPKAKAEGAASKTEQALAMLKCEGGASGAEIAEAMGWLPHTTRAWISTKTRALGLTLSSEKVEGRGRVYSVAA